MKFDIHKFDKLEFDEVSERKFYKYVDTLLELFFKSPEGEALAEKTLESGFWAAQLIDYGYNYIGVTLPQMSLDDVHELLTDIFPRKISLQSPDEARETIPELIAFWEFLKREFKLSHAAIILSYLRGIDIDRFVKEMNDPANFGMAKSFFMQGQQAGFDMTDEEELGKFSALYNLSRMDNLDAPEIMDMEKTAPNKRKSAKMKQKRKQAKADRKRNRKKKRKK